MLRVNQLAGFGSIPPTVIHTMYRFTGSGGPYLSRNIVLSGEADGKAGTVSFWLQMHGEDNAAQKIFALDPSGAPTVRFQIGRTAGNKINIQGYSSVPALVLNMTSLVSVVISSGMVHIMASWDLAATIGHLYISGSNTLDTSDDLFTNTNIDYAASSAHYRIGKDGAGAQPLNACLGGLYFSRTYIDLSNAGNRAKFYNAANIDNFPVGSVSLGADGSTPESAQPILYLNSAASWGTNLGSGGDLTVNGVLEGC